MNNKRFTKDPVRILLSKLDWFYTSCIENGEQFKGQNEYDIVREVLTAVERNNPANRRKVSLQLIKD